MIDRFLLDKLCCPVLKSALSYKNSELVSEEGRRYPVVNGIPYLLLEQDDLPSFTHKGLGKLYDENKYFLNNPLPREEAFSFIGDIIVATNGNLYRGARPSAPPVPVPRNPFGGGRLDLLDVGCNFGRWSIAYAQRGFRVFGVDPHLKALLAAQQLCEALDIKPRPYFVAADARYLPFKDSSFASVFSYSVLQHLSRQNLLSVLEEVSRILGAGGRSFIQMPNALGVRNQLPLMRRGYTTGDEFDVRYYLPADLLAMFASRIGASSLEIDCFLGLNVRSEDLSIVRRRYRPVIEQIAHSWVSRIIFLLSSGWQTVSMSCQSNHLSIAEMHFPALFAALAFTIPENLLIEF